MGEDADSSRPRRQLSRVVLVETDRGERLSGALEVVSARGIASDVPSGEQPPEAAIAWARGAAEVVVVQAGGLRFSAGRVDEPGLQPWADGLALRPGRYPYEPPGAALEDYTVRMQAEDGEFAASVRERLLADAAVRRVEVVGPSMIDVVVRRSVVAGLTDDPLDLYVAELLDQEDDERVGVEFEAADDGTWRAPDGTAAPVSTTCWVVGAALGH